MTTYYAAPEAGPGGSAIGSSSNNGLSQNTPFRISDFWGIANPGDILNLLDGYYIGPNSMIAPPAGLSGSGNASNWPPPDLGIVSGSQPITVQALNDGSVLIDGEWARVPISLAGVHWFVVSGVNARNGNNGVILTRNSPETQNTIIRRVVAWDTLPQKNDHVILTGGFNILVEDCAFFGTGRKSQGGGGTNVTLRRIFSRSDGHFAGGGGSYTTNYNDLNRISENIIVMHGNESQPESYNEFDDPARPRSTNFVFNNWFQWLFSDDTGSYDCINNVLVGSLVIVPQWETVPQVSAANLVRQEARTDCMFFEHIVAVAHPNHPNASAYRGLALTQGARRDGTTTWMQTADQLFANNITTVSVRPPTISSLWQTSNIVHETSLSEAPNAFTTPLNQPGGNLCHKYVNGSRTSTPLWPWPMNSRIKAAIQLAGRSTYPCNTCSGVGPRPRPVIDVTQEVQSLLGSIPSQCWDDNNLLVSGAPPGIPTSTRPLPTSLNNSPTFGGTTGGNGFSAPLPDGTSFVPGECTNAVRT